MSTKLCFVELDAVDHTDKKFNRDLHRMHITKENVQQGKGGGGSDIITLIGPCGALRKIIQIYWDNDSECLAGITALPEGE